MKQYSAREFIKIMRKNGFEYNRTKGSHQIYCRDGITVPIPIHLNQMIARRLIKEHCLEV